MLPGTRGVRARVTATNRATGSLLWVMTTSSPAFTCCGDPAFETGQQVLRTRSAPDQPFRFQTPLMARQAMPSVRRCMVPELSDTTIWRQIWPLVALKDWVG